MIEYNSLTGEATEIKYKFKKCSNRKERIRPDDEFPCEECGTYGGGHGSVTQVIRTRRPELDAPKAAA